MWYGFIEGAPAIWTYSKSQKIANLRRDPRVTCLVEDGETYGELRGVELVGNGQIIEDKDVIQELGGIIYGRYFGTLDDAAREAVAVMGAKRLAVRIDVERFVSWDHEKLEGLY